MLLTKVQALNEEVEKRDSLLDFAKSKCVKRSIPMIEKQFAMLRTPSQLVDRVQPQWIFLGHSDSRHHDGVSSDVQIVPEELDDEGSEQDSTEHTSLEEQESDNDGGAGSENDEA